MKKLLTILVFVLVLFSSCNQDAMENGIFQGMMDSSESKDYKIRRFAGKLSQGELVIEVETGIDLLTNSTAATDNKIPVTKARNAQVVAVKDDSVVYLSDGKTYVATSDSTNGFSSTELSIEDGSGNTIAAQFEFSYYNDGNDGNDGSAYTILTKVEDVYYILSESDLELTGDTLELTLEGNQIPVEYKSVNIIGPSAYVVENQNTENSSKYTVYIDGKDSFGIEEEILAYRNGLFFTSSKVMKLSEDNKTLETVKDSNGKEIALSFSAVHNKKLPISDAQLDGKNVGFSGNKCFLFNSEAAFDIHSQAISDVSVVSVTVVGNKIVAFTASAGIFTSTDGKTFTQVK